jgi:hypothetical protein
MPDANVHTQAGMADAMKRAVLINMSKLLADVLTGEYAPGHGFRFIRDIISWMTPIQAEQFFDVVNLMVGRAIGSGRDFTPAGFLARNIHFAETSPTAAQALACWVVGVHRLSPSAMSIDCGSWIVYGDVRNVNKGLDVFSLKIAG